MEKYDPQMAQRVWNRVWTEPEPAAEADGHFMMAEVQALADYTSLLRRFPEIKPLAEDIRHHIACLRGIRFLKDGSRPKPVSGKPRQETEETTLRRCYAQSLKTAAEYAARSEDPEYGCVYAQLAESKRRHCRILLQVIGNADRTYIRK